MNDEQNAGRQENGSEVEESTSTVKELMKAEAVNYFTVFLEKNKETDFLEKNKETELVGKIINAATDEEAADALLPTSSSKREDDEYKLGEVTNGGRPLNDNMRGEIMTALKRSGQTLEEGKDFKVDLGDGYFVVLKDNRVDESRKMVTYHFSGRVKNWALRSEIVKLVASFRKENPPSEENVEGN